MSFTETFTADFRGSILTMLAAAEGECSLAMLRAALAQATPHNPAMDTLKLEIDWLATRGLLTRRRLDGVIEGVMITERGQDVAARRLEMAGVDVYVPE